MGLFHLDLFGRFGRLRPVITNCLGPFFYFNARYHYNDRNDTIFRKAVAAVYLRERGFEALRAFALCLLPFVLEVACMICSMLS